ncbi:hypothetical protein C8R46DRAFT_985991 [Mycena filopes]|nr:hypothetical protein C8R46DRAFT_985991 [Mycena filopes]
MTLGQELRSFWPPAGNDPQPAPAIGVKAPSSDRLLIPSADGRPIVITFLRHCGCPFAEKTFKAIRAAAEHHPHIRFIAVSHSEQGATDRWVDALGGSENSLEIVVDTDRKIFAQWGLGVSSFGHFMSPVGMWAAYRLGKEEGIWNRPTESGNRWQMAGSFAVDEEGILRWGRAMRSAAEIPNFEEGVESVRASKAT